MKLSRRASYLLVVVAVLASVSLVVYATVSQTFPAVTVPALVFATHANCTTIHIQGTVTSPNGTLIGNCPSGTSTIAAFTVNRDGTSTPTFSITTSGGILTTKLGIGADGSGCGGVITPLTSGVAVPFTRAGAWIYCLSYTSTTAGGTINQFNIAWSP